MGDVYCSDCKKATDVVICDGLVLESHPIDETSSEWRTFAIESNDNNPVRVGGPTDLLLADGGLSSSLGRWQNRGSNPDGSLAFKTIASMADGLGVAAAIKDHAFEIYKKFEDHKSSCVRNQEATLAACLYLASRQDKPLTVKEICSVAKGATKKEIGRAKEYIVEQQSIKLGGGHMELYCSNLGMNNQAVKAAEEAVKKSKGFDIRRSLLIITAAVIYIVTQLSDNKKPLKDVSSATRVAEGTIRSAYKDLYPHISKIIPSWYATDADLKNLCSP